MVITYVQAAQLQEATDISAANRRWRGYVNFLDRGGRKPLPYYGIREVHRNNIAIGQSNKLWQEYVDE